MQITSDRSNLASHNQSQTHTQSRDMLNGGARMKTTPTSTPGANARSMTGSKPGKGFNTARNTHSDSGFNTQRNTRSSDNTLSANPRSTTPTALASGANDSQISAANLLMNYAKTQNSASSSISAATLQQNGDQSFNLRAASFQQETRNNSQTTTVSNLALQYSKSANGTSASMTLNVLQQIGRQGALNQFFNPPNTRFQDTGSSLPFLSNGSNRLQWPQFPQAMLY